MTAEKDSESASLLDDCLAAIRHEEPPAKLRPVYSFQPSQEFLGARLIVLNELDDGSRYRSWERSAVEKYTRSDSGVCPLNRVDASIPAPDDDALDAVRLIEPLADVLRCSVNLLESNTVTSRGRETYSDLSCSLALMRHSIEQRRPTLNVEAATIEIEFSARRLALVEEFFAKFVDSVIVSERQAGSRGRRGEEAEPLFVVPIVGASTNERSLRRARRMASLTRYLKHPQVVWVLPLASPTRNELDELRRGAGGLHYVNDSKRNG